MKTTKIILTLLCSLTAMGTLQAQHLRAGIKGGLNFSNLYIDDVEDENVKVGFHAGVYGQIGEGNVVLQPELLYSTNGARTEYGGSTFEGEADFNLNYIDLPILATFKLGEVVDIQLGPYVGYLVGANTKTSDNFSQSTEEIDRDHFKPFDIGLAGGLGFHLSAITIGARYNLGLSEIADSDAAQLVLGDAKNSYGQLFIAFDLNQ